MAGMTQRRASRQSPAPHGVPKGGLIALDPRVFVGGQLPPYTGFVGVQPHLHDAFVDAGPHLHDAFVDAGPHPHDAFVDAGPHPHVIFAAAAPHCQGIRLSLGTTPPFLANSASLASLELSLLEDDFAGSRSSALSSSQLHFPSASLETVVAMLDRLKPEALSLNQCGMLASLQGSISYSRYRLFNTMAVLMEQRTVTQETQDSLMQSKDETAPHLPRHCRAYRLIFTTPHSLKTFEAKFSVSCPFALLNEFHIHKDAFDMDEAVEDASDDDKGKDADTDDFSKNKLIKASKKPAAKKAPAKAKKWHIVAYILGIHTITD
ncbi:hypothetical protein C8R44DRAFT_871582 [Mycena epipterygia]|nr:hypothetical protein C8R44DRAFT_871582 [Mycena epipterygia]